MKTFPQSDTKSETFSLAWKPFLASEEHAEFGFSEVKGTKIAAGEPADRIQRNLGGTGEDPNQPLCPLLPAVKRWKENKLAMSLEGSSLDRRLVQ